MSDWQTQLADAEALAELAAFARQQCLKAGAKLDPTLFKTAANEAAIIYVKRYLRGEVSWDDAQAELAFFVRCHPPHDFDYAIEAFQNYLTRRSDEQARVARAIREKCAPMIIARIAPEKIRQAASGLNPGILSDDEITEILRTEWMIAKSGVLKHE